MADSAESETKKCPNCRQMIAVATFDMHEVHCVRYCTYCEECEDTVPVTEYESHMTECHTPQPCPGCSQNILPNQLDQHKELCPEAMVQCKYCELDIKRRDYSEHVEACGSRTEPCELCSLRVKLRDLQEHKDLKCGHLRSEPALDPHTLAHLHSNGLDEQWVESVSGALGENVDSLLAENINYFQNVPAPRHSRRDHRELVELPPISQRNTEPPTINRQRYDNRPSYELPSTSEQSHEQPPADTAGDIELALRLQQEEMRRDQAFEVDQNLARQLQQEEEPHTTRNVSPPPTDHELAQRLHEEEVRRDQAFGRDLELARQLQQEEESKPHSSHRQNSDLYSSDAYGSYSTSSGDSQHYSYTSQPNRSQRPSSQRYTDHSVEESPYSYTSQPNRSQGPSSQRYTDRSVEESPYSYTSQPNRSQRPSSQRYTDRSMEESALGLMSKHAADYDDEDLIMLPCQFCAKMCPVEQLTLHQNSCRHGNHDAIQDLERDTATLSVAMDTRPCMYCYKEFPEDQCAVHETLCSENPDVQLKSVYQQPNGQSHSSIASSTPSQPHSSTVSQPNSSTPSQPHSSTPSQPHTSTLPLEEIPCETCGQLIPLSSLHRHQVSCSLMRKQPPSASHAVHLTRRPLHPSHHTTTTYSSTHSTQTTNGSTRTTNGFSAATGGGVLRETPRAKPRLAIRFPSGDEALSVNGHSIASANSDSSNN